MSWCEQQGKYCSKALFYFLILGGFVVFGGACNGASDSDETVECNIGEEREIRCGLNELGVRHQVCVDYQWVGDACDMDTECTLGTTRGVPCGLNGRGRADERCATEGYWVYQDEARLADCEEDAPDDILNCMCDEVDECEDGDTLDELACGEHYEGLKEGVCKEGSWVGVEDAPCIGENRCDEGDVEEESCGLNGRGVQYRLCENEVWADGLTECEDQDICVDHEIEDRLCDTSNGNMLQERSCIQGEWSDFGECTDHGGCQGSEPQLVVCGEDDSGRKMRVCSQQEWSYDAPCEQAAQRLYAGPYSMFVSLDSLTEVRAFGRNDTYQLGIDSYPESYVSWPQESAAVLPTSLYADHFDSATTHACSIADDGELYCWGDNGQGQLGASNASQFSSEPLHVPLDSRPTAVSVGEGFSCALTENKNVYCWGTNAQGQLGVTSPDTHEPQHAFSNAQFLSAGNAHVCAVQDKDPTYEVYCWGDNSKGQAGTSSASTIDAPTVHEELSQNPQIDNEPTGVENKCDHDPEWNHVLGLKLAGNTSYVIRYVRWRYKRGAFCRNAGQSPYLAYDRTLLGVGENDKGQLGQGASVLTTAKILDFERKEDGSGRALRQDYTLHASASALCIEDAASGQKEIRCIGDNTKKQLRDASAERFDHFVEINNTFDTGGRQIRQLGLGVDTVCVLLEKTKRIRCRGSNAFGQRGDGQESGPDEANIVRHIMDAN